MISCVSSSEKRLLRRWPRSDSPLKNLVVRSKSYNIPMLTPVCEHEPEPGGVRRHSVCQMTSFEEEPVFAEAPPSPIMNVCEDSPIVPELFSGGAPDRASSSSSPETVVDQLLESVDSDTDPEGIFIDFSRQRSSSCEVSRESESLA